MILETDKAPADRNLPPDLAVVAQDYLRQSPYRALRSVVCEDDRGALVLRGRLSSYYLKQMAQETVGRQAETVRVINTIKVT
jgi:hypothetical protein